MTEEQQQAAVNPASEPSVNVASGAPSALTEEAKKAMRIEAVVYLKKVFAENNFLRDGIEPNVAAKSICESIYRGIVPHVRFCYENN